MCVCVCVCLLFYFYTYLYFSGGVKKKLIIQFINKKIYYKPISGKNYTKNENAKNIRLVIDIGSYAWKKS